MYYLQSPKIINTNPICLIRNEVLNNRSEPTIEVSLGKIAFLNLYDIYEVYIDLNFYL